MSEFEPLKYTEEFIGPHLLESITQGLYTNPKHAIREYVQNAVEADPPPPTIKVYVKINEGEISIWDNGGGMNKEMLIDALKMGFSKKDPRKHFGFRGIGIWSGIAVCDNILISTKREGETKEHLCKISAKKIRDEYEKKEKPLTHVLSENVGLIDSDATKKKHGTHVRLIGVLKAAGQQLLSLEDVKHYMRFSSPSSFHNDFHLKDQVEKELKNNVPYYKSVDIYLNDELICRPPFVKELDGPYFNTISTKQTGKLAFIWYCTHKKSQFIKDPRSRGLVYKKFYFTIGNEDRAPFDWWEKSKGLFNWCVGEVHIINPDIQPNSERTDLENSPDKIVLVDKLRNIAEEIYEKSHLLSYTTNINKRIAAINALPDEISFNAEEEKDRKVADLVTTAKRLQGDLDRKKYVKHLEKSETDKIKKAVKRVKAIIKCYKDAPVSEVKEPEPTPAQGAKAQVPPKVEVTPVPAIPSLSDLIDTEDLEPDARIILESVEDVLDEFFADDQPASSEIKEKIATKIKERL